MKYLYLCIMQHRLAIFASGTGTNAENIIQYFKNDPGIKVELIVSNKPNAGVLEVAEQHHVDQLVIDREMFYQSDEVIRKLSGRDIDFIVLAGFLWLIPENLVKAYSKRMVNLHPALLPKFGGKGMYGSRVHEAVIKAGEKKSGITIHYVNEKYDEGSVIFQAECAIDKVDTPASLAKKVQQLEHTHFPRVIEKVLR